MRHVAVARRLLAVEELVDQTYGRVRIGPVDGPCELRIERSSLGAAEFHHVAYAMNFDAAVEAQPMLIFGELVSGRLRHSSAGSERHYLPGDAFISAQPGLPQNATVQDTEVRLIVVDPALPSQVADSAPARTRGLVTFTGHRPVSPQAGKRWTATCDYVRDHILAEHDAAGAQLLAATAVRLLVATALATFPNNALTEPTIEDRHDGSPGTLRRAVAFIDEHAHQDISMADIAAASGVTIRAVQLAFRRHLDTTPSHYLRRVRLDHAHRQLLAADPQLESVTAVSYQWGFASSSRFAAYYRRVYGVSPSSTLQTR